MPERPDVKHLFHTLDEGGPWTMRSTLIVICWVLIVVAVATILTVLWGAS